MYCYISQISLFNYCCNNLCIHYNNAYLKSSFCAFINFSSTTSSLRICSRHMRIVCRLRRLRGIPSRVFWRCRSILPRWHPFIRQIKTLKSRAVLEIFSSFKSKNSEVVINDSEQVKHYLNKLTLASAKDVILWFGENPCRAKR